MLQAEIRHSLLMIERSEKRIRTQHAILATIDDLVLHCVCEDILAAMEAKLIKLRSDHRDLIACSIR